MSFVDRFIEEVDQGLRVLSGAVNAKRDEPHSAFEPRNIPVDKKNVSMRLMRVNHTGEVCAQALYSGQAFVERDQRIKEELLRSSEEEIDHLVWTRKRVIDLGGKTSVFNVFFYLGSYSIGVCAGLAGSQHSLGFVEETERQVESHLSSHLGRLPPEDVKSLEIIKQMRRDEKSHGERAKNLGATDLPRVVKQAMKSVSKLMTGLTYYG